MLHINRHLCFLIVSSKAWNGHMESYTHIHTTWNHKLNSQKGQIREQTCQYNETPCLGHYALDDTLIHLSPLKARKCLGGELQSMTRTVKYSFDSTAGVCKRFLLSLFFFLKVANHMKNPAPSRDPQHVITLSYWGPNQTLAHDHFTSWPTTWWTLHVMNKMCHTGSKITFWKVGSYCFWGLDVYMYCSYRMSLLIQQSVALWVVCSLRLLGYWVTSCLFIVSPSALKVFS